MKQTVKSTNQLITEHITSSVSKSFAIEKLFVELDGQLGELKAIPTSYNYQYGVKLKGQDEFILMDIPKVLLEAERLAGGEYVTVYGVIKTKIDDFTNNRLEFRIEVSKIQATDSPAVVDANRQEQASLSKIRALNPRRNAFPFKDEIELFYITGQLSQVEADFLHEVNGIKEVYAEKIPADMTNTDEIVKAIESVSSKADIIVVIRGGGDDSQFEVFNKMSVITALSKSRAYRVLGLGHSQDSTFLDLVCDYSANTPTAAGTHIRETLKAYQDKINKVTERYALENRSIQQNNQQKIENLTAEHLAQDKKMIKSCFIVILVGLILIGLLFFFR